MKKIMDRLIALALSFCICCALIPTTFAAGEEFRFYYVFDKESYQVGDTVNVDVMVERTDSDADFDLYSYSLNALFKNLNLEYVGSQAALSDNLRITDTPTAWSTGYQYVVLSYNGLGSHISGCKKQTKIATLTFTAKAKVNGVVMDMLNPSIGIDSVYTMKPAAAVGKTVIGDPEAATYTVSFQSGGGTGTAPTVPDQAEGSQFLLPQNPYTYDNHTFLGWNDGTKTYQPGDTYVMPAKNVTFTAQWKQDKYQISFQGGAGTTGTAPDSEWIAPGTKFNMYTKGSLAKTGYTFKGWSDGSKTYAEGDEYTMPEKDVTFTAVWEENKTSGGSTGGGGGGGAVTTTYPVNVTSPANGTVSADKKTAAAGDSVTVSVTPANGYKVGTVTVTDKNGKTVSTTVNNGKYTFKMPSSAVTVNVTFTKDGGQSGGNVSDCPKDATCPIEPFTDTENTKWWHDGIHYCVENGLMNGVSGSRFAPNGTTTRAMIVTILWRMEGSPSVNNTLSFKDVPSGKWYTEAIRWAQSTGVVTGYNADKFGPDDNITREQLAAILYRYADSHKIDVTARNTLSQYSDAGQVSGWALDSIKWANAVGMVNGRTASQLAPKASATRAEAASMIQRFCQNILHWSK